MKRDNNNRKTQLAQVQKDPADMIKKVQSDTDFYNKYTRKQGEKVLSTEEYRKKFGNATTGK